MSGARKWLQPAKLGMLAAGFVLGMLAHGYFFGKPPDTQIESRKKTIAPLSQERNAPAPQPERTKGKGDRTAVPKAAGTGDEYAARIDSLNERLTFVTREKDALNTKYEDLHQAYLAALRDNERQAEKAAGLSTLRVHEQALQQKIFSIMHEAQIANDRIGKARQYCDERQDRDLVSASPESCEDLRKAKYQLETLGQSLEFYKDQLARIRRNIAEVSK